jgi:hypothetical protein
LPTGALKVTLHVTVAPAVVQPEEDPETLTVVVSGAAGVEPLTETSVRTIDCVAGEMNFGARRCVAFVWTGVYCVNETERVVGAVAVLAAPFPPDPVPPGAVPPEPPPMLGLTVVPPPPPPPHAASAIAPARAAASAMGRQAGLVTTA